MRYAVVIPALNPGPELIALADKLVQAGAGRIVVVNDGSDEAHAHIFQKLNGYDNVVILEHTVNLGKGAALKTAFTYCLEYLGDIEGVVTADCDGQHTPKDILRVAEALSQNPGSLILGARLFDRSETPGKSYIGNRATSRVFKLLYRIELPDTQTGLRGIPLTELKWMSKIKGRRYDYELNMLIQAKRRNIEIKQISVEVLYFDNNRGSHFKPVIDTMRVVRILLAGFFAGAGGGEPYCGKLFYFCRGFLRLFYERLKVTGKPAPEPAVFVGRHQNLKGAMRTMIWLDIPVRVWMLGVFCDRKSCFDQYARYTFTRRMGWGKPFANIAAYILAGFIPKLAKSMRAIPVYRGSVNGMRVTVGRSVETLCKGENVLLFPDIDYTSESDIMGEMYTGFVSVDKYYYKKTGRHIAFIPIRADMEKKRINIGPPSYILDGESFMQGKKRVCAELKENINLL